MQNPQWGYVIRGILDDNVPAGTTYKGVKVIGRIANLMIILPSSRLDEIAITLGLSEYYRLEEIVALCEKSGVHTKFIPDYNNIIPTKPLRSYITYNTAHKISPFRLIIDLVAKSRYKFCQKFNCLFTVIVFCGLFENLKL